MGWCHEFGPQIQEGCGHPMVAGSSACTCSECGAVCRGRFNGCAAVWQRGPVATKPVRVLDPIVLAEASPDRRLPADVLAVDFSLGSAPAARPKLAPTVVTATRRPIAIPISTPAAPRRRFKPVETAAPGLPGIRERLDGLRGELKLMGDRLGGRNLPPPYGSRDGD